jgi:hypothetical protein
MSPADIIEGRSLLSSQSAKPWFSQLDCSEAATGDLTQSARSSYRNPYKPSYANGR